MRTWTKTGAWVVFGIWTFVGLGGIGAGVGMIYRLGQAGDPGPHNFMPLARALIAIIVGALAVMAGATALENPDKRPPRG